MNGQAGTLALGVGALSVATLVAGGIGFAQGVFVLKTIGAESYGVAAVLVAVGSVAANLIDFRIADLVSREFYAWPGDPHEAAARGHALRFGLLASLLTGIAISVATVGIGSVWFAYGRSAHPGRAALAAAAATQCTLYVANYLLYVLRLTSSWRVLAASQLLAAGTNAAVMVPVVMMQPTAPGYIYGALGASVCNLVFAFGLAAASWSRTGLPVLRRGGRRPFRSRMWSLAVAGGTLGLSKLLHRSADTLLVALFCSERDTGLYRFARTATDALYVMFDAGNKVLQPKLLSLLATRDIAEVRRLIGRIAGGAALFGVAVLAAEAALLPALIGFMGPSYAGAERLIVVLTLPVLLVLGVQLWLWPILLHHEQTGLFAAVSLISVLALQYTIPPVAAWTFAVASALPFALGYAAFDAWSLIAPIALRWEYMRPYLNPRAMDAEAAFTS